MEPKNIKLFIKIIGACIIIIIGIFFGIPEIGKYDTSNQKGIISDQLIIDDKTKLKNIYQKIKDQNYLYYKDKFTAETKQKNINILKQKQKAIQDQILAQENQKKQKIKETNDLIKKNMYAIILKQHLSGGEKITDHIGDYQKICETNQQICEITSFEGEISDEEKFNYQSIIIYILSNLDQISQLNEKIQDNLFSTKIQKYLGRRGYAGHYSMIINVQGINSYPEFFEVFTHELGHIIDLGIIKGLDYTKDDIFTEFGESKFSIDDPSIDFYKISWIDETTRKKTSSFKDFVSGYALTDPFEDFAETFNMYINHYDVLQKMAENNYTISQKVDYIRKYFGKGYFQKDKDNLTKIIENPDRRPWDSTKL